MSGSVIGYRVSALAIGLGSLVACGGGGSGSSNSTPTTPATDAQKTQTANMTKSFVTMGAYTGGPQGQAMVVGDKAVACPMFLPALVAAAGCFSPTWSSDKKTCTMDFSGCPNMSGSITYAYTFTWSGIPFSSNFTGSFTISYNNFGYHYGSDASLMNGTVTITGNGTYTLAAVSSFDLSIKGSNLVTSSTVAGVPHSWTGAMDLHETGTGSGASAKMQEWGSVSFSDSNNSFSAEIPPDKKVTYDSSLCLTAPISGTMNWTAHTVEGNAAITATFGPNCGSFSIDGQVYNVN